MLISVSVLYGFCLVVIVHHTFCRSKQRIRTGSRVKGRVIDVIDANTFVIVRRGQRYLIKLAGLKPPRRGLRWYDVASWALVGKLLGRKVVVVVERVGPTGFIIGRVRCGKQNISHEMISEGHGRAAKTSPIDFSLFKLEREARRQAIGIWKDDEATKASSDRRYRGYRDR